MNWNNFENQKWRERFFDNGGLSMVYLCLESFGGVLHDIPINVKDYKNLHLNPYKSQLI